MEQLESHAGLVGVNLYNHFGKYVALYQETQPVYSQAHTQQKSIEMCTASHVQNACTAL